MARDEAGQAFAEFVAVIQALRTPGTGCPWDLEQDHHTLRPYLVEEAYEVLDAIDGKDDSALCEELGDLLLQVVLHAQVADDRGAFAITEVVHGITEKMRRRHPHVFGSVQVSGSAEVVRNWEEIKAAEGRRKSGVPAHVNALRHVPEALPALRRAQRLGEEAARISLDWPSLTAVFQEVRDEFARLEERSRMAVDQLGPATPATGARRLAEELRGQVDHNLGDMLFSLCQLARWLGVDAEDSLRASARRFADRFQTGDQQEAQGMREEQGDNAGWQVRPGPRD